MSLLNHTGDTNFSNLENEINAEEEERSSGYIYDSNISYRNNFDETESENGSLVKIQLGDEFKQDDSDIKDDDDIKGDDDDIKDDDRIKSFIKDSEDESLSSSENEKEKKGSGSVVPPVIIDVKKNKAKQRKGLLDSSDDSSIENSFVQEKPSEMHKNKQDRDKEETKNTVKGFDTETTNDNSSILQKRNKTNSLDYQFEGIEVNNNSRENDIYMNLVLDKNKKKTKTQKISMEDALKLDFESAYNNIKNTLVQNEKDFNKNIEKKNLIKGILDKHADKIGL